MKNNCNLKIKFNEKNICLNKITVVSGVNGSGKSTVSRILYCFLKSMSPSIDEYILRKFVDEVNKFIKQFVNSNENYNGIPLNDSFTIKNNYSTILNELYQAKSIFFGIERDMGHHRTYYRNGTYALERIGKLINLIETKDEHSIFNKLNFLAFDEMVDLDENIIFQGDDFKFVPNNVDESYFNEEFIASDVFYIDNFSILDLKLDGKRLLEHVNALNYNLDFNISKVEELPDNVKNVLSKIEIITQGTYPAPDIDYYVSKERSPQNAGGNLVLSPECIPSGIKQITVLWLLLANFKLQNGGFLLFDEPEVNLHPDWQFKFAEILVILAKELDVKIYINSHSPMFIESINAFSEYYDMLDDVNYYLTEETDEGYNFTKIHSNKLYKIYNNLGNVYDKIDKLRLKKILGE